MTGSNGGNGAYSNRGKDEVNSTDRIVSDRVWPDLISSKPQLTTDSNIISGYLLPGLPHLLLAPETNSGWMKLRQAYDRVCSEIQNSGADLIVIYSTYWPSVIGHQIQADPEPEWVHVDDQFHDLGSIPYKFKFDASFAEDYKRACQQRGLHARTIAYKGFPIDTGSVVALKLINPDNKIPACIVSSNVYADRAETVVLGKAVGDALKKSGKKAVAVAVSSLSNRLFTEEIDPKNDKIHSLKDQEWNEKLLEFLADGRLEDVSQLSRQFHREVRVHKVNNFKPFWWLSSVMGQNNLYSGKVYEYQPVLGTGNAVVGLQPAQRAAKDLEFDEDDPEVFAGDRNVLGESLEDISLGSAKTLLDEDSQS